MKKKIFLISFIFAIILCINSIVYGNEDTQKVDNITIVNPNYDNVLTEKSIIQMIQKDNNTTTANSNFLSYEARGLGAYYKERDGKKHYYYENEKDAANYVKSNMVNRKNKITVRYQSTNPSFQQVATSIVKKAISEDLATNSSEGDYLAWSYGGYIVGGGYYKKSNTYYWVLDYTFTYYTTLKQEQELDKKVQKFVKGINIKKESNYSIAKQANDYICDNVEYDYANVLNKEYKLQFTAYQALINNKAVCQGYATLYYKILKECGVKNRIVVSSTHSWNLVKIDKKYYNVDIVWNDQRKDDYYFLAGSTDFVFDLDHIRNIEYTTSQFNSKYPTAKSKFQVDLNKVTNLKVKNTTNKEINLMWDKQDNITGYKIYIYDNEQKCWQYYKQVKGYKSNACKIRNLKENTIYKFRVRAYATVNNKKEYGQYSNSFKTTTSPKAPTIKYKGTPKKAQIRVGWKKPSGANGYQLQCSTNSKFSASVKKYEINNKNANYKTIKNLKKGKKYYIRVRAYRTYKGKKYYSNWSKVTSIKSK